MRRSWLGSLSGPIPARRPLRSLLSMPPLSSPSLSLVCPALLAVSSALAISLQHPLSCPAPVHSTRLWSHTLPRRNVAVSAAPGQKQSREATASSDSKGHASRNCLVCGQVLRAHELGPAFPLSPSTELGTERCRATKMVTVPLGHSRRCCARGAATRASLPLLTAPHRTPYRNTTATRRFK